MVAGEASSLKGADIRLRERIEELDETFKRTGYLYGLEKLELMDSDPVKFDKFQWRIIAAANTARETSKYVSGSPAAVGMSELCDLIALPEGDVVVCSFGLAGHIGSFPIMIREMAKLGYEDNPGIKDTDIWGSNDPQHGCPHPADMYTFLPIFHEGELVCWVCGANHTADCGHSICAGGVPVYSPTAYCDGLIYGPMKIGERVGDTYVHYQTHLNMLNRLTRTGVLNILDEKMRLTGAVMLRDRVLEIIRDFGLSYFQMGLREILERERRAIAHRFQQWMVPGVYRQVCFRPIRYKGWMDKLYPQANRDWVLHHNQLMTIKPSGDCDLDADGTSSQDYFYLNGYEGPFKMGATFSNLGYIGQTPMVNTALFYVLNYIRPLGSVMNPTRPDVSCCFGNAMGTWHGGMSARAWGFSTFLKGFLEEAYILEQDWELFGVEGLFQNDVPWAMSDFTYDGGEARGPSAWRDGEAMTLGAGNPEGDFGEAEEWEYVEPPLLILSRSLIPDYCAHGRQRGAIGIGLTQLVCDPGKYLTLNSSSFAGSWMNCMAVGICGGYPHLSGCIVYFHDTNAFELLENGETLPTNFVEAYQMIEEGKLKVGSIDFFGGHESPPIMLKHGDLVCHAHHAGSAWGDPIEREFDLIAQDVENGWISLEVARSLYGAVLRKSDGTWQCDAKATEQARQDIRDKRKARAIPAKEFYLQERQIVVNKQFQPHDVYEMFRDAIQYDKWHDEFYGFWQLSEDYRL